MSEPAKRVTAADIKLALRRTYAQPEWALLFEVGDATGGRHTRFADALAMSLWPSRGLTLTGMEIKVSRSDWTKERANPEKAEAIAAYCDYWQLVTGPKVVVDPSEIPPSWGWLEFNGERFVTRQTPTRTDAKQISRPFLAALLRRAHKTDDEIIDAQVKIRNELNEQMFAQKVEQAAARNTGVYAALREQVEQFEAASGMKISSGPWISDARELGRAAKAVVASGIDGTYGGLHMIARDLRQMSERIEKAMSDVGLPPETAATSASAKKKGRKG